MKITFFSNLFNHHQKDLCDSFFRHTDVFSFVATMGMPPTLRDLGYTEYDNVPYIINSFSGKEEYRRAKKELKTADITILGGAPIKWHIAALFSKALIFRFSERQLRSKIGYKRYIYLFLKWHIMSPNIRKEYLLSTGAYAAADYKKFLLFRNRSYKWGYFPECKRYDDLEGLIDAKRTNSIVWCARLCELKHPEIVISVANELKKRNYSFHIDMIGSGELFDNLKDMIKSHKLSDYISLTGAMKQEKVREMMEKSSIFLFTSDSREGWGAVLNEAMNSACVPVASIEAGAVPYLIKDGFNGYSCSYSSVNKYIENIIELLENPDKTKKMAKAAYDTIVSEWNAETAAVRLIELSKRIMAGEKSPDLFKTGPCSRA